MLPFPAYVVTIAAIFFATQVVLFVLTLIHNRHASSCWEKEWLCHSRGQGQRQSELLDHLEQMLSTALPFVLLSRLTAVAPLLGVMVTAFGLLHADIVLDPAGEVSTAEPGGTMHTVFRSLQPLYWGVLMGASLAIVNQVIFVPLAQSAMRGILLARAHQLANAPPASPADAALQEFARSIHELRERVRDTLLELRASASSAVGDTSAQIALLASTMKAVTDDYSRLAGHAGAAGKTLADSAQLLRASLDQLQPALQELAQSADKLKDTQGAAGDANVAVRAAANDFLSAGSDLNRQVILLIPELRRAAKDLVQVCRFVESRTGAATGYSEMADTEGRRWRWFSWLRR